jgi:Fe2+ transport system protein FeoA
MKPGQKGRIDAIDISQPAIVRLMVLGLIENVQVQVENIAIGGDPIEVSVYGSSVSMRRQDARLFKVSLDQTNG